jgi:hypothetical protein
MSAMLTEPESDTDGAPRRHTLPDASALVDRMPDWFRTSRRSTLAVAVLALLFTFFARRPLWHTDLWGHLAYGRLIWQTRAIPETEPFMPLAVGMPLADTAWLSQLIGYAAHELAGAAALQFLYAAAVTLCLALLLWLFIRKTNSLAAGFVGLAALLWMEWQALGVIRPQLAALCCFVALFTLLSSRRRKADWFFVPAIMVLWANLHGSFPVGLILLGTLCLGRGVDVFLVTRRLASRERRRPEHSGGSRPPARLAVWRDGRFRRLFLLTELAALAVLINPYGFRLYEEVFALLSNPNLADLQEWEALTLRMKQGQAAFAVGLALIVLLRLTPRRITTAETLLLAGFGAASLWSSRFLVWWAPLAATSLAMHAHAVLKARRKQRPVRTDDRRSLWTVASVGLCWIAFGLSPLGLQLLHGVEPKLNDAVSAETPVGAAEFLRDHPPRGQIFNPDRWGDYLVWAGPDELKVFITTHAHLVPRRVWLDYFRILSAGDDWDDGLARYGVGTVVINRYQADQRALLARLRSSTNWKTVFQDDRSEIFQRVD